MKGREGNGLVLDISYYSSTGTRKFSNKQKAMKRTQGDESTKVYVLAMPFNWAGEGDGRAKNLPPFGHLKA